MQSDVDSYNSFIKLDLVALFIMLWMFKALFYLGLRTLIALIPKLQNIRSIERLENYLKRVLFFKELFVIFLEAYVEIGLFTYLTLIWGVK